LGAFVWGGYLYYTQITPEPGGATPYHPQNTPPLIPRICSDLLRSPYRYYEKLEKSLSPGDTG